MSHCRQHSVLFPRPKRACQQRWPVLTHCKSSKELEESIQAGLDEQEQRDAANKQRAQEYKQLNDQLEETAKEVRERLQGASIYLVGMMGSGKSTVGKLVARALQYPFLDSDQIAEEQAGTTISRIFEEEGEEAFRDLESAVLQDADKEDRIEATQAKLAAILDKRKDQYAQADLTISLLDQNGNPLGASVSTVAYRLVKALNDRLKKDKKCAPGAQEPPEFKGFGKQP